VRIAALLLLAIPAVAQAELDLRVPRETEPAAELAVTAPAQPVFRTKISRPSIRDHLREYRVRVRNDGIAVHKRFAVGR
jgi:hypothetical protein